MFMSKMRQFRKFAIFIFVCAVFSFVWMINYTFNNARLKSTNDTHPVICLNIQCMFSLNTHIYLKSEELQEFLEANKAEGKQARNFHEVHMVGV